MWKECFNIITLIFNRFAFQEIDCITIRHFIFYIGFFQLDEIAEFNHNQWNMIHSYLKCIKFYQ